MRFGRRSRIAAAVARGWATGRQTGSGRVGLNIAPLLAHRSLADRGCCCPCWVAACVERSV